MKEFAELKNRIDYFIHKTIHQFVRYCKQQKAEIHLFFVGKDISSYSSFTALLPVSNSDYL